jgi:hypothetical protein
MSEPQRIGEPPLGTQKGDGGKSSSDAGAKPPPDNQAEVSPAGDPAMPKKLTAEEQMALYEKSLKEDDWGHQPC